MSDALPTGEALSAKARRLQKRSTRVDLAAGGSYTLRKLSAGAISSAGPLLAGIAEASEQGEDAVRRFTLEHLGEFLPLVASAIVAEDDEPVTMTTGDVGDIDFDDFLEIIVALDFGEAGGAAAAQRGFPADGRASGMGAGGSDDPHRA